MTKRKSKTEVVAINFNLEKWLNGAISSEPFDAQGLFIALCAYYGHKGCNLKLEEVYSHFKNHPTLEILKERFFKVNENGYIAISYVDEEFSAKIKEKIRRQQNGKLGGLKAKQIKTHKNKEVVPGVLKSAKGPSKTKAPKEDFKDRKKKFGLTLQPYEKQYGRVMLQEFYNYWTEPLQKGGGNRFRQEAEVAWELSRRLETWFSNNYSAKGVKKQTTLFDNAPKAGVYIPKPKAETGESLEAVQKRIALELEQKSIQNKKESNG
jgi:hypothetical protein